MFAGQMDKAVTPRHSPHLGLLLCAVALAAPGVVAAQGEVPLAERVARLERTLSSKGLVELAQQIEALQQEVRQLRGELENQAFALEQVRKSQRDAYGDVDRRLSTLEQNRAGAPAVISVDPPLSTLDSPAGVEVAGAPSDQTMAIDTTSAPVGPRLSPAPGQMQVAPAEPQLQTVPGQYTAVAPDLEGNPAGAGSSLPTSDEPLFGTPPAPSGATPSLGPAGTTVDSAESEAAYRDAFAMLKAGQYEQSIAAFNNYLQQYPSSQYADNAQYWLGEAYYVMRQYEPAIQQYQKLVNGYPDSQKQSHAMLKIAYSYDELGLAQQAAGVLAELKQKFPGSAAARLADERLQRMRAESP